MRGFVRFDIDFSPLIEAIAELGDSIREAYEIFEAAGCFGVDRACLRPPWPRSGPIRFASQVFRRTVGTTPRRPRRNRARSRPGFKWAAMMVAR